MNSTELLKQGGIYFEEIRTGFSEYNSEVKKLSGEEAAKLFQKMWKESYPNQTYVDFYYYRLEEEAKRKVETVLDFIELEYLKSQVFSEKVYKEVPIIFPMDEMLLSIITKLNETEMLFSTVYFAGECGKRSTWWGNYNQEYIVFTDKENRTKNKVKRSLIP